MKEGMSLIVKTVARILSWVIALYGAYIVAHGHLTPGGGFAGGTIIACAFILLFLAYGSEAKESRVKLLQALFAGSLGVFFFWLIALLGLCFGTYFFSNLFAKGKAFCLFSGGIIPVCNATIGFGVAGALCMIFIGFAAIKLLEGK